MSEEVTPRPATNPTRRTPPPYRVDDLRRSARHLFETISVIVTVTVLLGGLGVGAVLWVSNAQSKPEAVKQHEAMRLEFQAADIIIDRKADNAVGEIQKVGRDVQVIKCLVDPTKSAKAKRACGLDP